MNQGKSPLGGIYRIAELFLKDDVTAERRYTAIETFNYRLD